MVARALVGLERHRVFDQDMAAANVVKWPTIDDSDYKAERRAIAGLGRMPHVERED
jgi:hypothetical protein